MNINIHEGARRMQRAGQWMIFIPLSIILVLWGIKLGYALFYRGSPVGLYGGLDFILVLFYLTAPGAVLWLAGWIVEGFAKKDP